MLLDCKDFLRNSETLGKDSTLALSSRRRVKYGLALVGDIKSNINRKEVLFILKFLLA